MNARTSQVAPGWAVVGLDGNKIGEVTEKREDHLVVSAGTLTKDTLYVPIDQLRQARDGTVVLRVEADKIDEEGWRFPPNAGYQYESPAYPEVPETTTIQAAGYSSGRLSAPEPQGALLNDGMISEDEVPNEDVGDITAINEDDR